MKINFKKHLLTLLAVPALAVAVSAAPVFAADDLSIGSGANAAKGTDQTACLFPGQSGCDSGETPLFQTITNVLLFIIGAVSVIMLIIGGIRYTISQGDSSAVTSAKNTILYSVIGLIVAILAFAIVNFVISNFADGQ